LAIGALVTGGFLILGALGVFMLIGDAEREITSATTMGARGYGVSWKAVDEAKSAVRFAKAVAIIQVFGAVGLLIGGALLLKSGGENILPLLASAGVLLLVRIVDLGIAASRGFAGPKSVIIGAAVAVMVLGALTVGSIRQMRAWSQA
jgi:hypothetical protein